MNKKIVVLILISFLLISSISAVNWDSVSWSRLFSIFYQKSEVDSKLNAVNATSNIRAIINVTDYFYDISIPCSNIAQDGGADADFCNDVSGGGSGTSFWDMYSDGWIRVNQSKTTGEKVDIDLLNVTKINSTQYCNMTNCYTVSDFLTDTTGTGSMNCSVEGSCSLVAYDTELDNKSIVRSNNLSTILSPYQLTAGAYTDTNATAFIGGLGLFGNGNFSTQYYAITSRFDAANFSSLYFAQTDRFTGANYTGLHTKANHYTIGVLTIDNETAIDTFIANNGYALGSSLPNLTMSQINASNGNHSQWLSTYPNVDTDSTNDLDLTKLDNGSVVRSNNLSTILSPYQLTAGAYNNLNSSNWLAGLANVTYYNNLLNQTINASINLRIGVNGTVGASTLNGNTASGINNSVKTWMANGTYTLNASLATYLTPYLVNDSSSRFRDINITVGTYSHKIYLDNTGNLIIW